MPGTLILCAGPIGNLGDAPPRLAEALAAADVVFAEDTRRAKKLLNHLGVDRPTRSFFVGNEADRAAELADRLRSGETVALVTDAGTPAISDPGLTAVGAAVEVGATVSGIPGPSAVTMALAVSGLPADRFVFEGFLPRKGKRRTERIGEISTETRTVVLFGAPGRLASDLADLAEVAAGDRPVVVCRELTKVHEEIWRGTLDLAAEVWAERTVRGEVTVVLGGAEAPKTDVGRAIEMARRLVEEGVSARTAGKFVAAETGVSRREVYEALIDLRSGRTGEET